MKENEQAKVIGLWDWFFTIFLLSLPLINIILVIYWSFNKSVNPNRANFARAAILYQLIVIMLSLAFISAILGSAVFGDFDL